ncbi:hypothetical protein HWV62_25836 [Athelia sp. TMB]|nr:hypothetical protein HWV62_25836 [Athelia sp. TMB]
MGSGALVVVHGQSHVYDLRRVVRGATGGLELECGWRECGHAPVGNLDARRLEQRGEDVLGFEIVLNAVDAEHVRVCERGEDLAEEHDRLVQGEVPLIDEKELAAGDVLEHTAERARVLEHVADAQDSGPRPGAVSRPSQ